jgi:hypothetical protein
VSLDADQPMWSAAFKMASSAPHSLVFVPFYPPLLLSGLLFSMSRRLGNERTVATASGVSCGSLLITCARGLCLQ